MYILALFMLYYYMAYIKIQDHNRFFKILSRRIRSISILYKGAIKGLNVHCVLNVQPIKNKC